MSSGVLSILILTLIVFVVSYDGLSKDTQYALGTIYRADLIEIQALLLGSHNLPPLPELSGLPSISWHRVLKYPSVQQIGNSHVAVITFNCSKAESFGFACQLLDYLGVRARGMNVVLIGMNSSQASEEEMEEIESAVMREGLSMPFYFEDTNNAYVTLSLMLLNKVNLLKIPKSFKMASEKEECTRPGTSAMQTVKDALNMQ